MEDDAVMLEIQKTLVSLDVIEQCFVCDLETCKGACCIEGESGAPLNDEEKIIIEELYPIVREYITPEGIEAIEQQGWYVYDSDGDCVTPLVNGRECAYTYRDRKGITRCAFEKAYCEKKIDFIKPISCHLYPVRITKYNDFDAVNYEANTICKAACNMGADTKIPLYVFLKQPFIRLYGDEWYNELKTAALMLQQEKR